MTRRDAALGSGAVLLAGGFAAAAEPGRVSSPPGSCGYDVFRSGTKIGEQALVFRPVDGGFESSIDTDIVVKLMGITVYRYVQRATDRWQDGQLRQAAIETEDNGKRTRVRVTPQDDGLAVDGPAGAYTVAAGSMTDLCFWTPQVVAQLRLIDGQNGEFGPIQVGPAQAETIDAGGRRIAATRYAITGTQKRSGVIWYDADGRLWRSSVITKGEQLEFERRA